jgi:hypothetical protein
MFRPHMAIFRCYSILSRSWCSVMPIFCLCQGASHALAIFRCYSILSRSWCSVMPIFCLCQGASHALAIFRCYSILSRSWCSVMPIFCLCQGSRVPGWHPRANAELVPKLHVALHASHAALRKLTCQNFALIYPSQSQTTFRPTTAAPTSLKTKIEQIPNTSLTSTRRTSGHCLGNFKTTKFCLDYLSPLQHGTVSHYPSNLVFSHSL